MSGQMEHHKNIFFLNFFELWQKINLRLENTKGQWVINLEFDK